MIYLLMVTFGTLLFLGQSSPVFGQNDSRSMPTQEFFIQKITPKFVSIPEYHYTGGPFLHRRNNQLSPFLALEVEFFYKPQRETEETRYADDLLFTYYLLLNARNKKYPNGILLVGSVIHTAVRAQEERYSVMYVAPSTLDRCFPARIPSGVFQVVYDIGITISKESNVLTSRSWKGQGEWWKNYSQLSGWILNKNQTPFAPILWNDYEQIRMGPSDKTF